MKVIIKSLAILVLILLMVIVVLALPLWVAFAVHDRIRYGVEIPNVFSELADVLKDICGNISKIISL